jgi:hypothetical protein
MGTRMRRIVADWSMRLDRMGTQMTRMWRMKADFLGGG